MAVFQNLPDFDDKLENIKRHVILKRHSNNEHYICCKVDYSREKNSSEIIDTLYNIVL